MKKDTDKIDLEAELDYQFPKGDDARGRALVLYALAKIKMIKQARMYEELLDKLLEAYGIAWEYVPFDSKKKQEKKLLDHLYKLVEDFDEKYEELIRFQNNGKK